MMKNGRRKRYFRLLSLILPFALPAAVFLIWLGSRCSGQEQNPLHIVASMNLEGGRTTTFSTILPDGNEAVWECSHGGFIETGDIVAMGRSVTWQPSPGLVDSVSIIITTPTVSDTVRFLPVIPDVVPSVTVSAAYHLCILERARSIQMAPGIYRAVSTGDALSGYDGLVILIVKTRGGYREAFGILPGDTLMLSLPLGGIIQATGLDSMEDAMDNEGNIRIVFELLEVTPQTEPVEEEFSSEPPQETSPSGEQP
ncbi:MAG: hypothetical protein GQ565_12360 [Candidatus Aegiribacteria sp.]|nr:hypothetical protein [Candidatus Aegiribacteria sp.]